MLELVQMEAAVVHCLSEPNVLDGLPAVSEAVSCRVAPDEVILLSPRQASERIRCAAADYVQRDDPYALVVEQEGAWSVWMISGPETRAAFARLSSMPLPKTGPAFVQGGIAGVPGKVLLLAEGLCLMVSSSVGHHLRDRILAACADLGVTVGLPQPWPTRLSAEAML